MLYEVITLVDEAQNGVEAVEKMAKNPYDLVFMDVHMPMLDGLEATRTIRRMGIETPIIALSAHVSDDDREKSLEAGMQEHLTKPFRPRNLYEALERFAAPAQRFHAATIHGWSRELPAELIESSDELEEMWGDFQSFAKKLKAVITSYSIHYTKLYEVSDDGDIVAPWRGFPTGGYTRAMAQYNWRANTKTTAAEVYYDFDKAKLVSGLGVLVRYAMQDFDEDKQAAGVQADSNIIHIDIREQIKAVPGLDAKIRIGLVDAKEREAGGDKDSYNEFV